MSFYQSDVILSFLCHSIGRVCQIRLGVVPYNRSKTTPARYCLIVLFCIIFYAILSFQYHSINLMSVYHIPDICHFFYMYTFQDFTLGKCVNLQQNCQKQYFFGSSGFFYTQPKILHAWRSRRSWQISGMFSRLFYQNTCHYIAFGQPAYFNIIDMKGVFPATYFTLAWLRALCWWSSTTCKKKFSFTK